MLRRTAITFIGAILAAAALPAAAQDGKTLNFGIISTESSSNQKQVWQPVIDDLSRAIGVPVKPFFASDYAGIIEGMRFNKVQMAWYGNKSAIEAVDRANGEVFASVIDKDGNPLLVAADRQQGQRPEDAGRRAQARRQPELRRGRSQLHVRHRSAGLLPVGRQQDRAQDLLQDRARQQPRSQPAVGDQQAGGRGRQQHRVAGTLSHQHRQGRQRARARVVEVAADSGGSAGHAQGSAGRSEGPHPRLLRQLRQGQGRRARTGQPEGADLQGLPRVRRSAAGADPPDRAGARQGQGRGRHHAGPGRKQKQLAELDRKLADLGQPTAKQ